MTIGGFFAANKANPTTLDKAVHLVDARRLAVSDFFTGERLEHGRQGYLSTHAVTITQPGNVHAEEPVELP